MIKAENGAVCGEVRLVICFTHGITLASIKNLPLITETDLSAALKYVNEEDQILHIVSAYLKRKYVQNWQVDEYGKPISKDKHFNVSHCKGAVAIVLAEFEVGVDIENVREVETSLIDYVSSESEREKVTCGEEFFRLWTAKESLSKAQGRGITNRIKDIPAMPYDGEKVYRGEKYYSRQIAIDGFIISVTQKDMPFKIDKKEEQIL